MKLIPPKKKRHGTRTPGPYTVSWVMCEFVKTITGLKKETIQSYFTRANKKLTDYKDVYEYLKDKKYLN